MIAITSCVPVLNKKKLSIIIPAFNESATIRTVIDSVLHKSLDPLEKEVIVVESNSTDGTRDAVLRYTDDVRVTIVLEDRPRGKGHAVRTGLQHATGDFILIQDADVEYDLEDYDVLLEPLLTGRHAFVLGSRHGGKTWKLRQFSGKPILSALFNVGHGIFKMLVNVFYRLHLKDPFTMYKVFRRDCLTGLRFECNYFDFDYEILIKLARKGYIPVEIPVNYRARSFKDGKKVSIARDPWTWLRAIVKFRWSPLHLLKHVEAERLATRGTDARSDIRAAIKANVSNPQ
jgi:glycosyltransferase involved in cell wall biosynthesis